MCDVDDTMNFFITGDPQQENFPKQGDLCMRDWIMIFGKDKYCGIGFTPVTGTFF